MKPILFNTDMVRAIMDGRKTVTRRVMKPQPPVGTSIRMRQFNNQWGWSFWEDGDYHRVEPPYQPGDILYVPEAWRCFGYVELGTTEYCVEFQDRKTARFNFQSMERAEKWAKYLYKSRNHWQSPYFMPREAARLFLRVMSVRAERLQDIYEEGAVAEGLYQGWKATKTSSRANTARQAFMWVWNSTIKPADREKYGWAANPWVWVIEFERTSKEEAAEAALKQEVSK